MKFAIAILVMVLYCLPASACNGYSAGYSLGYSYAYAQPYFQVVAPVQAVAYVAPVAPVQQQTIVYQQIQPVTTAQYSYTAPLSTVVQYQLPVYAPVQPYYANYGFSYGSTSDPKLRMPPNGSLQYDDHRRLIEGLMNQAQQQAEKLEQMGVRAR